MVNFTENSVHAERKKKEDWKLVLNSSRGSLTLSEIYEAGGRGLSGPKTPSSRRLLFSSSIYKARPHIYLGSFMCAVHFVFLWARESSCYVFQVRTLFGVPVRNFTNSFRLTLYKCLCVYYFLPLLQTCVWVACAYSGARHVWVFAGPKDPGSNWSRVVMPTYLPGTSSPLYSLVSFPRSVSSTPETGGNTLEREQSRPRKRNL